MTNEMYTPILLICLVVSWGFYVVIIIITTYKKKTKPKNRVIVKKEEPTPQVILAVFPNNKRLPLDLRNDFITFISQISTTKVIALLDEVPYTRLVNWVKRLVATNEGISILYIAAHGHAEGIMFSNGIVDPKRLASLAKLAKIELVILMTCDGYNTATTLRRHGIKSVLYIDGKVDDAVAIALMRSLIGSLADGLTLKQAVEFLKAETPHKIAYAQLRITEAADFNFTLPQYRED